MIMYSYYGAMACRFRKIATAIAPVITVLQISQMVVGASVVSYSALMDAVMNVECKIDPANYKLGIAMYLSYFALFVMLFYSKYLAKDPVSTVRIAIGDKARTGSKSMENDVGNKSKLDDFCTATTRVARHTDGGGFFHSRSDSISASPLISPAPTPLAASPDSIDQKKLK